MISFAIPKRQFYTSNANSNASFFRRNNIAVNHIQNGGEPSLAIIQTVLALPPTAIITQEHINLCATISSSPVELSLPVPNSSAVLPFSKVAGPEHPVDATKRSPGCYMIIESGEVDPRNCYIGHSVHMGGRVKGHAAGRDQRTMQFIRDMVDDGLVLLFPITPHLSSITGDLTVVQFLCVLEQYLFFLYRPLVNGVMVASPGISLSPEAILMHQKLLGTMVYVYQLIAEGMILQLVHVFNSSGSASTSLGFERTWVKGIISRGG